MQLEQTRFWLSKFCRHIREGRYEKLARSLVFGKFPATISGALIINVVTAGTADIPVAEECALFLTAAGLPVQQLYDVGVAGIHRLLDNLPILRRGAHYRSMRRNGRRLAERCRRHS